MGNPSNHCISLLPGASKQLNSGSLINKIPWFVSVVSARKKKKSHSYPQVVTKLDLLHRGYKNVILQSPTGV